MYLMATKPDLKIKDPYALDQTQFKASVDLLKQLKQNWNRPWAAYTDEVQDFESGATTIGTAWQVNANIINADGKVKVDTTVPNEGVTGWSDTWMIAAKAAHPNCMYKWMDYIVSPKVNAQVAQWFGEAPAQTKACDEAEKGFCDGYHALDSAYAVEDLLLDHPDQGLPRRPWRDLHRLLGMDPGLDGDQGVTVAPVGAPGFGVPPSTRAGTAGRTAVGTDALAGRALPRFARGHGGQLLLERGQLHRRSGQATDRGELPDPADRRRLPDGRAADPRGRGRGDADRPGDRAAGRVRARQGGPEPPAAPPPRGAGDACRCGRRTS